MSGKNGCGTIICAKCHYNGNCPIQPAPVASAVVVVLTVPEECQLLHQGTSCAGCFDEGECDLLPFIEAGAISVT